MARRLIDISVPLENDVPADPEHMRPKIAYATHRQTAPNICRGLPVGASAASGRTSGAPKAEAWRPCAAASHSNSVGSRLPAQRAKASASK